MLITFLIGRTVMPGLNYYNKELMRKQLDDKLKHLQSFAVPKDGWVKTICNALGMSSSQLARRCKISKQRLNRIETDELSKKTTLSTLEKVAEQLECKLVYAFVPKDKLSNIVERQARKKAMQQVEQVAHSMSLENQSVSHRSIKRQLHLAEKELLSKNQKNIWN